MPTVIEIYDPNTGGVLFYQGLLAGVVFDTPDPSLNEENGWHRVRMSEAQFRSWQRKVLFDLANTKKFWLS